MGTVVSVVLWSIVLAYMIPAICLLSLTIGAIFSKKISEWSEIKTVGDVAIISFLGAIPAVNIYLLSYTMEHLFIFEKRLHPHNQDSNQ